MDTQPDRQILTLYCQALKVLQHCLLASEEFIRYWMENSQLLQRLSSAKCGHLSSSCKAVDLIPAIRDLSKVILVRLSHQEELESRRDVASLDSGSMMGSSINRQYGLTPPPTYRFVTAKDLRLDSIGVVNCTQNLVRTSLLPQAEGTFSNVYKEVVQDTGQTVCLANVIG